MVIVHSYVNVYQRVDLSFCSFSVFIKELRFSIYLDSFLKIWETISIWNTSEMGLWIRIHREYFMNFHDILDELTIPTISSWIPSKSTSGGFAVSPRHATSNDVSRSARHIFRSPPFGSTRATADSWRSSCRAFRCNTPCVAWPLPLPLTPVVAYETYGTTSEVENNMVNTC